jgi:uncharacterized iron-regulated membrane protein
MMLKPYLLRFHRWITLVFALPLLAVIGTGLVLSFEPLAQQMSPPKPMTTAQVVDYLERFDPQSQASALTINTYEHSLTLQGVGPDGEIEIDLRTGQEMTEEKSFYWSDIFLTARRMHETLLLQLRWLVTASTVAMLLIMTLGIAMGWPRLRNTLAGWHNVSAWLTLPLLILSPLTGLAIVMGITLAAPAPRSEPGGRVSMINAVRAVGAQYDLAGLTSIRARGGRLMARVYDGGELRAFAVTARGIEPLPRNWTRLLHEGNWGGPLGSILNLVVSVVLVGLLGTGLTLWVRRKFRPRRRVRNNAAAAPAE